MVAARLNLWLPVVLWAALIFTFSSIPSLGTGLGTWDLVLRKLAHAVEFGVLGALLFRALRREPLAILLGSAYAVTDEVHQAFVSGRQGSPLDWLVDTIGVVVGVLLYSRWSASRMKAVAVDLEALGDTRPLWRDFLADAARRFASISPSTPRRCRRTAAAAEELDHWAEAGVGDWRGALARFAEDRAPVYCARAPRRMPLSARWRPKACGSACSPTRPSRWPASRWLIWAPSGAWTPWSRGGRARESDSSPRWGTTASRSPRRWPN